MKLIPFIYTGPASGVTLNVGTEDKPSFIDVLLRNKQRCELPEGHPVVATLQAQGFIKPEVVAAAADSAAAPLAGKTSSKKG